MTAPKPNITLADGQRVYLPPGGRDTLNKILKDQNGFLSRKDDTFKRLVSFGLVDGVQHRLSGMWVWTLTAHGRKVHAELFPLNLKMDDHSNDDLKLPHTY